MSQAGLNTAKLNTASYCVVNRQDGLKMNFLYKHMSEAHYSSNDKVIRYLESRYPPTDILPLTLEEFYYIGWSTNRTCTGNISVKIIKLRYSYIIEDNNTGRSIELSFVDYINDEDHFDVECFVDDEFYEGETIIGELLTEALVLSLPTQLSVVVLAN